MSTADNRLSNRTRSFLKGEIIHSNGNSRTDCTIRDLSAGGARIEAPPSVTVPEFFELEIPLRNMRQRARIVWRHSAEIGVSFQNQHQPPSPSLEDTPLEIKMRMMELELETAKMRAQIVELRAMLDAVIQDKKTAI